MNGFAPSRGSVQALLPAWNAAEFIQPTLDCLSAQTHGNFGVIVSVDHCDDGTHELCLAHARKDPRFTVFRQQSRKGYVGNLNFLLGQATADHVLFAFHDDILEPTYLERLGTILDQRPEVVMSFSDVHLTYADGKEEHCVLSLLEGVEDRVQRGLIMIQGNNKWWVPNRGLFRRERASRIGGLKTHGAGEFMTDWPWLFHMSLLGQFARVPETLCFKYYKPGSLSRTWEHSVRQVFEARSACMRELWDSELASEEKMAIATPLLTWMTRVRQTPQFSAR